MELPMGTLWELSPYNLSHDSVTHVLFITIHSTPGTYVIRVGSCGSLVRAVHWLVRFTGWCGSLVREVDRFVRFTGWCGSLVRAVHWFTGS